MTPMLSCLRPRRFTRRAWLVLVLVVLTVGLLGWLGSEVYAEIEFQLARSAGERYEFDEALAHLRVCLRLRPGRFQYCFRAARAARRAGRFREAHEHLDRCQQLAGDRVNVSLLERTLLRAQQGEVLAVDRALWAAVKDNHPEKNLILEALAQGYVHIGYLTLAEQCLAPLVQEEPEHAEAWLWRAAIFELMGNRQDTAEFYRKALELRPDNPRYRLRLASFLLQVSSFEEARPHLEKLCAREPDNPDALVGMARLLAETGRPDAARAFLGRALEIQATHSQGLLESAKLAFRDEQIERAEDYARRVLAVEPTERAAIYLLYQCLEKQGKKTEAARQLVRFKTVEKDLLRIGTILRTDLPRNPGQAGLYYELSAIFARNGRLDLSRTWHQQASRLSENRP
jgi:tetratricopeptide (TPR) repeat protein